MKKIFLWFTPLLATVFLLANVPTIDLSAKDNKDSTNSNDDLDFSLFKTDTSSKLLVGRGGGGGGRGGSRGGSSRASRSSSPRSSSRSIGRSSSRSSSRSVGRSSSRSGSRSIGRSSSRSSSRGVKSGSRSSGRSVSRSSKSGSRSVSRGRSGSRSGAKSVRSGSRGGRGGGHGGRGGHHGGRGYRNWHNRGWRGSYCGGWYAGWAFWGGIGFGFGALYPFWYPGWAGWWGPYWAAPWAVGIYAGLIWYPRYSYWHWDAYNCWIGMTAGLGYGLTFADLGYYWYPSSNISIYIEAPEEEDAPSKVVYVENEDRDDVAYFSVYRKVKSGDSTYLIRVSSPKIVKAKKIVKVYLPDDTSEDVEYMVVTRKTKDALKDNMDEKGNDVDEGIVKQIKDEQADLQGPKEIRSADTLSKKEMETLKNTKKTARKDEDTLKKGIKQINSKSSKLPKEADLPPVKEGEENEPQEGIESTSTTADIKQVTQPEQPAEGEPVEVY